LSGNAGTFLPMQIMLSDKMGNTVVNGVNGVILAQPALVRGTGVNTVEWTVNCERLLFEEGVVPIVGV